MFPLCQNEIFLFLLYLAARVEGWTRNFISFLQQPTIQCQGQRFNLKQMLFSAETLWNTLWMKSSETKLLSKCKRIDLWVKSIIWFFLTPVYSLQLRLWLCHDSEKSILNLTKQPFFYICHHLWITLSNTTYHRYMENDKQDYN